MMIGDAYDIPTVALRFFNVYGPCQALSNPYTGVLAIFASRLLNDRRPMIFEDGEQRRDFVSVHDIATACSLALRAGSARGRVLNIGSGRSLSVLEVAREMAHALGIDEIEPEITGKYRTGDIRHCFADISRAEAVLGYRPQVTLGEGLEMLVDWMLGQRAFDRVDAASQELARRGLQR